ncbi:MAG: S26 family signal peptidase [Clostridia bacterium]|nr:S26 family signal peptidase [Clostridia bacterium]
MREIVRQNKNSDAMLTQIRATKQICLAGESMLPSLDPQSIQTLFISEPEQYRVGDVVVFAYDRSIVGVSVHRIVRVDTDTVITKGDNNFRCDDDISKRALIGKVEKALLQNFRVVAVASSKRIARLSLWEDRLSRRLGRGMQARLHALLVKMYCRILKKGDK